MRPVKGSPSIARLLTSLTTFDDQLPQGPSTSPGVANQVLRPIADRIAGVCSKHGLTFSILGDDLTISGGERAKQVKALLCRIIEDHGFKVNKNKIVVYGPRDRKLVTGIIVNQKLNVSKEYYRGVRAILHNCRAKGPASQFEGVIKKERDRLLGKINYIERLNPAKGEKLREEFTKISWIS